MSNNKKRETNFFNTSLGIKIYSKLKLDFRNLDCSDLDNQTDNFNFMQFNLLELESHIHEQISTILNSPTLSLFEKQKELERFSYENQNYKLNLDYHLPQQLNKMVKQIDKYMLNKDQLYSTDNSYYLISNIQKGLGNLDDSNKTQNYLTSKNTKIIKILKIILQVFQYNNQSFGLFVIYNFIYKMRKNALKIYDGTDSKPFIGISKKIDFSNIEEETSSDNKYIKLDLSLVELVSFLGKSLIVHYNTCRPVVVSMLQQQILEKDNSVNYTNFFKEKKNLISKHLEINDQILFHNLNSLQKIDAFNDKTEFELGIICTLLLQIVGLISETLVSEINDTSYKTVKELLLNKKYRDSIFTVPANPRKLPMILRPNFWHHETKDINLHFGGYLYNEKLNYPGVFNRHKKGVATFTEYELQAINYLQSNFYEINSEFLKILEENSKDSILNYLKGIPRYSHLFFAESKSDFLIVKNFSQFLTTDSLYQTLLKQKEETISATKSLKHEILRVRQRLKEEYQILFNLLVQFVHAYSLSVLFEGYKLYFCIFLDARGRMYYTGSGGGFGLQAGGFGKYVLDLKGNDFRDDSIILEKIPLDNKYYLEYKNQVEAKAEDFFEHLKVHFKIKQTTIGRDASCSGTSIISGLIGDLNGMLLTNVLYQSKDGQPKKKSDIYENFGHTLKEKYPNSYNELKPYFHNYKNFVHVHLQKYKIEEEHFKLHVNNVLAKIKSDILKRSSLKQFVMCKNYSQGDQGRGRYIFETCDYFLTTQAYNFKIDNYICKALGKWVSECYKAKFPKISDFCALLLRSINHKQPVTLISGVHTVTEELYHGAMKYQQVYSETVTIRYPNVNPNLKGRTKKLNYSIMTDSLDERKAKQSLLANFIHYLDSRLCLLVIYKCQLKNICIWTNHDCFYVHPNSITEVIQCYFDSYKFLLLEHNLIENFIAVNNGKLNQKDRKLIEEFKASRLQILKEIESKTLMLSPFCLN